MVYVYEILEKLQEEARASNEEDLANYLRAVLLEAKLYIVYAAPEAPLNRQLVDKGTMERLAARALVPGNEYTNALFEAVTLDEDTPDWWRLGTVVIDKAQPPERVAYRVLCALDGGVLKDTT